MHAVQPLNIPGRFTALDGWRGVCAILVALYHLHTTSHLHQLGVVRHAYLFVDFFFVLSGFVLTYAYLDRLRSMADAAVMMWRRLGRLWPLHVAVLAAFIALELSAPVIAAMLGVQRGAAGAFDPGSSTSLIAIPTNLLMLHGLGLHDRLTWNQPSWSISAELWTYAVMALVGLLLPRRSVAAAIALVAGSLLVLVLLSTRHIAVDHDLGLFRCVAGFFIGHLVFRLMKAAPQRLSAPTAAETAAVVLVIAFVTWAGRTPAELAAPFVFGLVVWVFALEEGAVSKALKVPLVATLGLISYSIYLVHALLIALVNNAVTVVEQMLGVPLSHAGLVSGGPTRVLALGNAYVMDLFAAGYVLALCGIAMLTWRWIEMPAQRWWNGPAAARLAGTTLPATRTGGPATSGQAG